MGYGVIESGVVSTDVPDKFILEVNNGQSATYSFLTTSSPVIIRMREISGNFSQIKYDIYRDGVVSAGTIVAATNMNDQDPVGVSVTIKEGVTVDTAGTLMQSKTLLSSEGKKLTAYGGQQGERTLKNNTQYYVTVTNQANDKIEKLLIDLVWSEGV